MILETVLAVLLAAGLVAAARVLRRGSLVDRVLGLDVLLLVVLGAVGVDAARRGDGVFVGVLLAVAFLGFLGTVGVAHYVARRGGRP